MQNTNNSSNNNIFKLLLNNVGNNNKALCVVSNTSIRKTKVLFFSLMFVIIYNFLQIPQVYNPTHAVMQTNTFTQ